MGKYTKAPGMHEFAYNSWLGNLYKKLNDRIYSASLNRDFFYTREKSWYNRKKLDAIRKDMQTPIVIINYCKPCDLFIYKNKLINRDKSLMVTPIPCKQRQSHLNWLGQ